MTTKDTATELRRIGAAIFAMLTAALAPLGAWADTWTDASENVWTYSIANDVATVSGVSFETTNLTIPSTLGDKPVTGFTAGTFKGKERAVRVTIPDTVTAIPDEAFFSCANLKSVTIQGDGLKTIGARAFKGCKNLEAFVMPNSVTLLGQGAFSGCTAMSSVTLSDGLTELPGVNYYNRYDGNYVDDFASTTLYGAYDNGLFYACVSLKTINWGSGVNTIGNIAFLNCSALKTVEIPVTVTSIGAHAFMGCASLTSVKTGNGVSSIGIGAFRALPDLTTVTIGDKVTVIGQQAFQDCTSLTTLLFGKKVRDIGVQAFQGCVNLMDFILPSTIQHLRQRCFANCSKALRVVEIPANSDELDTELEQGVFSGCEQLTTMTFGDTVHAIPGVNYYNRYDGNYVDDDAGTTLYGAFDNGFFYNCKSLKTINWGNGIRSVGNIAFLKCSALESVTIPDTVASIGYHAFLGCENLTTVKIGNGVTTIYPMAFLGCDNLTTVKFGAAVKDIRQRAFQNCVNLQDFTLPSTIQYLRDRCFAGCCNALKAVSIPANVDGRDTELGQGVFSGCSSLEEVSFGDTVKELTGVDYYNRYDGNYVDDDTGTTLYGSFNNGMFYNCTSLRTINWGNGIRTIGNVAFVNCTSLTDVTLPDSVTDIGMHSFWGCKNLTNFKMGDGVTTVGRCAFRSLSNLTKVVFGANVDTIGVQSFRGCENLQNFTLPDTIQRIQWGAFADCNKALTSVSIPANKSELDTELALAAFANCEKLTTVSFGDTLKVLPGVNYYSRYDGNYVDDDKGTALYGSYGAGVFYNCKSLKTINWGNGIKTIGNVAFLNCTSLTEVELPANIANIGNHAFYGCSSLKKATVKGSVDSLGRRAFANCPSLVYVEFQGPVMTFEPGYQPFAFDSDALRLYAAPGSTGWRGVAEVPGLPDDGKWCGVPISYGVHPTFTITFSRNDSSSPLTASKTYDYGVTDQLPSLANLGWARRGFVFKGWATSQANAANGKVWKSDKAVVSTTVAPGKTLSVWAVWEIASDSYAIRFTRNDGAGTWRIVGFKHGVKTRIPTLANGFGWARRGYQFNGWALTAANANNGVIWKGDWANVSEPVAKGAILDVYASWSLKPGYYQVRFNKNDGTGKWRTLGFQRDTSAKLNTIAGLGWERAGYEFVGWASNKANADAGKVWKNDGAWIKNVTDEGKTLSIYAIWRATGKNSAKSAFSGKFVQAVCGSPTECEADDVVFYRGVLADGSGTYCLLAEAADAIGERLGLFHVERGESTETKACIVTEIGGGMLLELECGGIVTISPDGVASLGE